MRKSEYSLFIIFFSVHFCFRVRCTTWSGFQLKIQSPVQAELSSWGKFADSTQVNHTGIKFEIWFTNLE